MNQLLDQEYIRVQRNSLEIAYPSYIKKRLLLSLANKGLIINDKRRSNGGNNLFVPDVSYVEDINEKIENLFCHMDTKVLIDSIEELEFTKEYRHVLWFKIQKLNLKKIMKIIKKNESSLFSLHDNDFKRDTLDEEASVLTVKLFPSCIYIKFSYLLTPKTSTYSGKDIKYVVLARIDIENEMLELCFDKVKFDYRPSENFYNQIIDSSLSRLTSMLELDIVNIDFKELIYYIKENKEDVLIVSMKMRRNGTVAHLDSSDNEDYTIPILGELKEFINQNAALFSSNDKCKEIENELNEFIGNIEFTSDLPSVKLKWTESGISLGANHNYHMKDYTFFMLYDELSTERRRIDYVREYFIKCSEELRKQIQSESLSEETN